MDRLEWFIYDGIQKLKYYHPILGALEVACTESINTNEPYMLAVAIKDNANLGDAEFYINGRKIDNANYVDVLVDPPSSTLTIEFGRSGDFILDEWIIYDKYLDENAIARLWSAAFRTWKS